MRRVVILFPLTFQASIHLGKDVTQFGLAISERLNASLVILCFGFIDDSEVPPPIQVHDLSSANKSLGKRALLPRLLLFLFKTRGSVVAFVAFFWGFWAWISLPIYRLMNGGGLAVNKLDGNPRRLDAYRAQRRNLIGSLGAAALIRLHSFAVSLVVCESEALRDSLIRNYPRTALEMKSHVIQGGLTEEFTTVCETFYPRGCFSSNRVRVLMLGRINLPFKGLEVFLEAIKRVKSLNIEFVISGPAGPWSDKVISDFYETRAGCENQIRLAPGVIGAPAVARLMSEVDVLCLPSIDTTVAVESTALVLGEAVAAGVYFVASDAVPSAPDLARAGFGEVFRSGDSGELAKKLDRLVHETFRFDAVRNHGLAKAKMTYTYQAQAARAIAIASAGNRNCGL